MISDFEKIEADKDARVLISVFENIGLNKDKAIEASKHTAYRVMSELMFHEGDENRENYWKYVLDELQKMH